jgi:drug/metabolite transporter (DMT)-like permease
VILGASAQVEHVSLAIDSAWDGGLMFGYGATCQVLGGVLISSSLAYVTAARVGLILLLQPTLSYVWDIWLFDLPITATQALGAAIALVAIYLGSR